ncbi:unnamed protein product [Musa textilis]
MANLADDFSPLSSSSPSLSSSSAVSLFKKPSSFLRSFSYHHRHPASKTSYKRFADEPKRPKVILYSTSLRGIRRTFADCCAIRAILRGFHVAVDDRDVSIGRLVPLRAAALARKGPAFLAAPGVHREQVARRGRRGPAVA